MEEVTIHCLDGSTVQTSVNGLALEVQCGTIHVPGKHDMLVVYHQGCWIEVARKHLGDHVPLLTRQRKTNEACIIYVLEETACDPLTYIVLPRGSRFPVIVTPYEVFLANLIITHMNTLKGDDLS